MSDNKKVSGSMLNYAIGKMLKLIGGKQDQLTFDDAPTEGSANSITSGGVKTALDAKSQVQIITWEADD